MDVSKRHSKKYILMLLYLFSVISSIRAQDKDLEIIKDKWLVYRNAPDALYDKLSGEAFAMLDARKNRADDNKDSVSWIRWQAVVKQKLTEALGPFPGKTPLNSRVTGIVKKNGFRIENIIYETLPGYYMTASLFIPEKLKKPAPAILFCSGHSSGVYRLELYQQPLLNLVKKGFIVLAIDPAGQGERIQYWDNIKEASIIGSSTLEHSYCAAQVFLLGRSSARYWIWDGIRSIDYLVSRKEVDPTRIGVHGLSGGGTQAAYISAMDDRVAASAPACYISSYRRLLESIGPQDGEQNLYHEIAAGIDHADFIEARAPKPTLIMANTGDFFSIQGARETFAELKIAYSFLGKPENIQIVEDDYGHGYTKKNREAMYAFFMKYLNNPGSSSEEEVEFVPAGELQKTPTGQLSNSLGGETVFSLNKKDAESFLSGLGESRKDPASFHSSVIENARNLSGFVFPDSVKAPVFTGRIRRNNYSIEKYFVAGEGNYVIPYLLIIPDSANGKAIIYLDPAGKEESIASGSGIEYLTGMGFTVLAPDLIGNGEMGAVFKGDAVIDRIPYNIWFISVMTGKTITGIHASDIIRLRMLLTKKYNTKDVYGVAIKELSPAMTYAAAFDKEISGIALIEPYSSYRSFIENRFYYPGFVPGLVPGALSAYDLPDLLGTLAPRRLLLAGSTDSNSERKNPEAIEADLSIVKVYYDSKNSGNQLILKKDHTVLSEAISGLIE